MVDVGIGYGHTCAVMSTGMVMCWGGISNPTEGELGNGSLLPAYTDPGQLGPREVVGITDAVQVVSGEYYSCALHAGGTVSCWGKANLLGDESASNRSTPGPVPGLTDVVGLSRVTFGICATRGSGQVSCWGRPDITAFALTPTALVLPEPVVATALVANNTNKPFGTCHLTLSGRVICNGPNECGQLANGTMAAAGVQQTNYTEVDLGSKTVQRLGCTVGGVRTE